MKVSAIRNWLGIYFLVTTVCLGAYILVFGETRLLPISKKDSADAFQIIIPVLVSQLTSVFTWFTGDAAQRESDRVVTIPAWVIKAPPLLVLAVIIMAIVSMILQERPGSKDAWIDASTFKAVVTFCVTILNATAVLVVIRFFGKPLPAQQTGAQAGQSTHAD